MLGEPSPLLLALPGSSAYEGSSPCRACPDPAWTTWSGPHSQTVPRKQAASLGQKAGPGRIPQINCPRIIIQRLLTRHLPPTPNPCRRG